jgi:hypothetical protein
MTPWQRIHKKFGLPTSKLAALLGRDRSKIYRHLNSPDGLISGCDQKLIIERAKVAGVEVTPVDLVPTD